ncbi:hypothetical protein OIU84_017331 [Salix udensis]|uniref:Uncharacterized protein n=1 Tax=Salix udensis TaxID=889485 RepID=A0AAD6L3W0_9ROSI|nr:hypothetical protein OIU84_017331 [Salix udensis]
MTGDGGIHSTGVKRMGGGHAHGHEEPFYLHANHMYNVDRMKYQRIKLPLAVFTAFSIGAIIPVYAVIFPQKRPPLAKSLSGASLCNTSNKFVPLSPFASRYLQLREHFSVTGNALAYPRLLGDRTLR